MSLSIEDVQRIARLSRIAVTGDELAATQSQLNQILTLIEEMRAVMYWGHAPDFALLAVYWLATAVIAWLGFVWFQKTRKGFADVL